MRRILVRREDYMVANAANFLNTEVVREMCSNSTCESRKDGILPRYPKIWGSAKCPDCGWILDGAELVDDEYERLDYHLKRKG